MTVIFNDGFESGDFSAWTGTFGSPTVSSAVAHHGTNSAYITVVNDGVMKDLGSGYSDLFIRFYVRFTTVPTSATNVAAIWNSGWADEIILAYDGTNWNLKDQSAVQSLSVNTWYCIEIERKVGSGTGFAKLWVDGVNKINFEGATFTTNGQIFAVVNGDNDFDRYLDCVVAADAYIGPEEEPPEEVITINKNLRYVGVGLL